MKIKYFAVLFLTGCEANIEPYQIEYLDKLCGGREYVSMYYADPNDSSRPAVKCKNDTFITVRNIEKPQIVEELK